MNTFSVDLTNKNINYYANIPKISNNRYCLNKSASRKETAKFNVSLENRRRREKVLINDRLHILDRMSNSLNSDDNKSTKDFSDAQSIRIKRKPKLYNPYKNSKQKVSLNLQTKFNTEMVKNAERSRMNNAGFYCINKSLRN